MFVKINERQREKKLLRRKQQIKKVVRYKRPILKFEKSVKAKKIHISNSLIKQQVKLNIDFIKRCNRYLLKRSNISESKSKSLKRLDLCVPDDYEYTDENTNIWYAPNTDAMCFQMENVYTAFINEKVESLTTLIHSNNLKEEYYKFLTIPLEQSILEVLENNETEFNRDKHDFLSPYESFLEEICTKSGVPTSKQENLISLIQQNQITVVGASRDDLNAFIVVPVIILNNHIKQKHSDPIKIICSTPHFLTAEITVKKLRKYLGEDCNNIIGLNTGFNNEKYTTNFCSHISICTNKELIFSILENVTLKGISHIILMKSQHTDDLFDLILLILRKFILKRRPDLKLIIISSPISIEIFSKYLNSPSIRLSVKVGKLKNKNPVHYLENILTDTRHISNGHCANIKTISRSHHKDYREKLEKHVNLLKLKGTFHAEIGAAILNPSNEGCNIDIILALLKHIFTKKTVTGCILIFLPNSHTIATVFDKMKSTLLSSENILVLKFHERTVKKDISYRTCISQGKPVIILATDHIEVLDRIKHVHYIIDCGYIEKKDYMSQHDMDFLELDWITRKIADERKTWCKSRSETEFYRLYTSVRGTLLRGMCMPLIRTCRPDNVIYLSKLFKVKDVFSFFDQLEFKIDHRSIHLSIKRLKIIGVLNNEEMLTPVGYTLKSLHLPPHLAKLAILGCIFSCIDPVLSIVTTLLHHEPFDNSSVESVGLHKSKLSSRKYSDHLLYVDIMYNFQCKLETENKESLKSYCSQYHLLFDTLSLLYKVKCAVLDRLHMQGYCKTNQIQCPTNNINSNNDKLVLALTYAGLYPNVAVIRPDEKITSSSQVKLKIHSSSINWSNIPRKNNTFNKYIMYSEGYLEDIGTPNEAFYLRDSSVISSVPVILFSHDFFVKRGNKFSVNDKNFKFFCSEGEIDFFQRLRNKLHEVIDETIVNKTTIDWCSKSNNVEFLKHIIELINCDKDVCYVKTLGKHEGNKPMSSCGAKQ